MPVLTDIGGFLKSTDVNASLAYGATTGNLFLGAWPDPVDIVPDVAVLVSEYGGSPNIRAMSTGQAGAPICERPRVQVMVRAAADSYATGRATAETIYAAMDGRYSVYMSSTGLCTTTTGVLYLSIRAVSTPAYIGTDQHYRHQWSTNYEIWKARG